MLNKAILKQSVRANVKLWLIFTAVLTIVQVVMIAVFNESTLTDLGSMVEGTMLEGLLAKTSLLGMLASTFFAIHGVIFPIIYIIMTANSLLAAQVDRGSMAYLLSTPTKRTTIVMTQAIYLIGALIAMFVIQTLGGVGAIQVFQGDSTIDLSQFMMLNVGLFLLMFATSGISFFFSSLCNLSKNSLAFGAGIPLTFFLLELLSSVDASLEKLGYFSLNALFDANAILAGEGYLWKLIVLIVLGVVLYIASLIVFKNKDLPL